MKSQKDELQRQRDALQRQIDLFEEQRRHWLITREHHASTSSLSRPDMLRKQSPSLSSTDVESTADNRVTAVGLSSQSVVGPRGGVADQRALPRVGSAGSVAALDSRTAMTRVNSAGNLLTWRRDARTLPAQLMSATNESRGGPAAAACNPVLRASTLPLMPSPIQQLIPTKLSSPSHNPSKTSRDQRGSVDVEKTSYGTTCVEKTASPPPAGSHVGSRDSARAAGTTSGNTLPMKLAEGHRERSRSNTSSSSQRVGQQTVSAASTAAVNDDDDVILEDKHGDDSETQVFYF